MSLFTRSTETRALSYQDMWGAGGPTPNSMHGDTIKGALRLAPVYSATSLICNLLSTAPTKAYRESTPGVMEALPRQPRLVTNPSIHKGGRVAWLHQGLSSVLLAGNAYGYVLNRDNAGTPVQTIWFNPTDVTVIEEQADYLHTPAYYWRGRLLDIDDVIHIPGYSVPGTVVGLSPIGLFKSQIETGLSAGSFQLDWYNNGAAPSGWFKNTGKSLADGQADKIKQRFKAAVKNRDLLVTGSDWDWKALSVPADQAQFLQAIQANATTIASIFHVSPEFVGGAVANSLTYKTLEQDGLRLNTNALRPWAQRFDNALSELLPGPQNVATDLDPLARGTVIERMQAHAAALAAGIETNDEARRIEGRPPLTPAQVKAWQKNYKTAPPVAPTDNGSDPAGGTPNDPNGDTPQ